MATYLKEEKWQKIHILFFQQITLTTPMEFEYYTEWRKVIEVVIRSSDRFELHM